MSFKCRWCFSRVVLKDDTKELKREGFHTEVHENDITWVEVGGGLLQPYARCKSRICRGVKDRKLVPYSDMAIALMNKRRDNAK